MAFIGQERIKLFLSKFLVTLKNQNEPVITPALLFVGTDNLGKATLAKKFGTALLCRKKNAMEGIDDCGCDSCLGIKNTINQDFYFWDAGKDSSIDSARLVIRFLSLKPNFKHKVLIIDKFDNLKILVQNVLLKSIEEPPAGTYIILIASNPELILETISSRVISLPFRMLNKDLIFNHLDKMNVDIHEAETLVRQGLGRPGLIFKLLDGDKQGYKEALVDLVKLLKGDFYYRSQYFKELFSKNGAEKLDKNLFNYWALFINDLISFKMGITSEFIASKELNGFIDRTSAAELTQFLRRLVVATNVMSVGLNNQLLFETVFLDINQLE